MNPLDDLIDFYAAIERCQIEAQLAGSRYQRIADDLERALSLLAGSLPGHPAVSSPLLPTAGPSLQTNAKGIELCNQAGESPATPAPETVRLVPANRGGTISDGSWQGGSNGERDVFDHVHRYPRGKWTP